MRPSVLRLGSMRVMWNIYVWHRGYIKTNDETTNLKTTNNSKPETISICVEPCAKYKMHFQSKTCNFSTQSCQI